VIDSVINCSDLSIRVDRKSNANFKLDVPAIQDMIAKLKVGIDVNTKPDLT